MSAAGECRLLGGIFASFIQISLAALCITTLAFKRYGEVPQRPWIVWALDVAKQSVGSSFGHFSNIFLSEIIATALTGGDECQWYCLSFILDSTLGTFVNLSLLHFVETWIHGRPNLHYFKFGEYGLPPSLSRWTAQLGVWLTLVIVGKVVCISLLLKFSDTLESMISYIFQNLSKRPQTELIVVMIIIPGIFNVISFWITDTFLKKQGHPHEEISQIDSLDEDLLEIPSASLLPLESEITVGKYQNNKNVKAFNLDKVKENSRENTSSLFSSSGEVSPSNSSTPWSSHVKLPDFLLSLTSKISTRGLRTKKSETDLESLSNGDI
mmetsp:Transcript_4630/g.4774  ORF Transcript_4630/g.4774 Transcript_4630/m.4774 type:complete len:325 (+) Transcript_4630:285-1259(+)